MGSPASQNGYSYTEGNPTTFSDPSGKCIDPISFVVCAALLVGGATFIGAVTGAAYDVFVNQGVGLGGKNQGNFSSVNLGEAAFNSGIGAGIGASIGFIGSQIAGAATVAGAEGLGSLAFTQVARAALWNITGTLFADSLAYHGLQQYANTGGVDLGSLATQESSNPLLSVAFFGDMALGAYEGYQSLGGTTALRAQALSINPDSNPAFEEPYVGASGRVVFMSGDYTENGHWKVSGPVSPEEAVRLTREYGVEFGLSQDQAGDYWLHSGFQRLNSKGNLINTVDIPIEDVAIAFRNEMWITGTKYLKRNTLPVIPMHLEKMNHAFFQLGFSNSTDG